jgi:hypothetical protein
MRNVPKSLLLLMCIIVLAASPASGQEKFSSFYARFNQAVAQKDTATLQQMMSPRFDFLTTANVDPSTVFAALDSNNAQLWTNLQTATQQASPVLDEYADQPAQLLWCTPTETIYNCYVVFQKNKNNKWRWRAFVMPQK